MQKTKFSVKFERALLKKLIYDAKLFRAKVEQIKPEFFEESAKRHQICTLIREHHTRTKQQPSLDYLADKILRLDSSVAEDCLEELSEIDATKATYSDAEFAVLLNEFCVSRQIQGALLEAVDDLERGDFDSIQGRINTVFSKKQSVDRGGLDYFDPNSRRDAAAEIPPRVPTPWSYVNELMKGGLGGGELGLIMGPSGVFKTQILLHMVKGALIDGVGVCYFSLEVAEHILASRLDCMFTGRSIETVRDFPPEVEQRLTKLYRILQAPLVLKQFPMRTAGVVDLRTFVSDWEMLHEQKIGMVVVDYPDLLKTPLNLGRNILPTTELFTQIRQWAVEEQIPIWAASQTNKSSSGKPLIRKDDVSEDWQKIAISDVVITINSTEDEFSQQSLRLFFAKARNFTPYIQVPLMFTKPDFNFREEG
jgi:replicative DNA helicase